MFAYTSDTIYAVLVGSILSIIDRHFISFSVAFSICDDNMASSLDDLFLDKPNTKKELHSGQSFGFASMQGLRKINEDCHKHLVPLDDHLWKYWSYFVVLDGHNGIVVREKKEKSH